MFLFALRWIGLILIIIGIISFFYFHLNDYFSFDLLKHYHTNLMLWKNQHFLLAVLLYVVFYMLEVSLSIPGASFTSMVGGYLFGPIATIFVIIGATIGESILFLIIRSTLGDWLNTKFAKWISKMKSGFQKNAFHYLLFLRLIPLFPFWAINITAALLLVPYRTFLLATSIGIIPGTFIYVMIGNGLNSFFEQNQEPNLNIIYSPPIFLPLFGLALLAILPVVYKKWKKL